MLLQVLVKNFTDQSEFKYSITIAESVEWQISTFTKYNYNYVVLSNYR